MNTTATNYYQKWIDPLPDRNDRILKRDLSVLKSLDPKNTRVHLIGICGKGTATLAGLLIDKGFIMSGSDDTFYPPMSTVVESLGIQIFKSYTAENINGADVIIVGNVCPPNNIEVVAAKEKNILQISMSEALEYFFLQDKKPIVVTGTHGKTTLTGKCRTRSDVFHWRRRPRTSHVPPIFKRSVLRLGRRRIRYRVFRQRTEVFTLQTLVRNYYIV